MENLVETIIECASRPQFTNQWVQNECAKVYIRVRRRLVDQEQVQSLDLATIEVAPAWREKGVMSYIIAQTHAMNPWSITYVENVLNPIVAHHLESRGWVQDPAMPYDVSYYKRTSTSTLVQTRPRTRSQSKSKSKSKK